MSNSITPDDPTMGHNFSLTFEITDEFSDKELFVRCPYCGEFASLPIYMHRGNLRRVELGEFVRAHLDCGNRKVLLDLQLFTQLSEEEWQT